jgi:hypothetical protein
MLPKTPRRGDPLRINSRSFAAALRAGEAFERDRLAKGGLSLTGFGAEQALVVNVVNTSGDVLPQFSLVGLGDVRRMGELDGEIPQIVCDWVQPTAEVAIGILLVELGEDQSGRVLLSGATWARVMHPCAGDRADAYGGNNHLASSPGGRVIILDKPTGEEPDPPEVALMPVLITQGTAGCTARYSLGIYNNPASGSVSITVTYNTVTESIVLDYDFTATEIKDAIDAHSEFVAESVGCDVETGSDWPHGIMLVTLPTGATMERADSSLVKSPNGYLPEFRVDLCCS